jgi:hypothetical protein
LLTLGLDSSRAAPAVSESEIRKLLVGKTVRLNRGQATFFSNGRYEYKINSEVSVGRYIIRSGVVCISFLNGYKRCSKVEKNGKRYIARTMKGKNFQPIEGEPEYFYIVE